jgi:undecaprenyl-diphosphatase
MVEPAIAVRFFRAAVLAFALERLLYKLIKSSVKRDRPCAVLANIQHRVTPPDQFSFPSGHTAAAFVICTLICYYFPILIVPVLAWALLVGLSRIYLGVHYPTDILAGMLIGTSSGATGLLLFG